VKALSHGADDELEELLAIALGAATIVARIYGQDFAVEMKSPGDPVTAADREANDYICERLAKSFPGDSVIAEESAPTDLPGLASLLANRRVFFVDPLDGTRDFAARTGEFAVMIGLAEGGHPTLGVLVLPARREALAGRVGDGCFLQSTTGERRAAVVPSPAPNDIVRVVVSRARPPRVIRAIQAELGAVSILPCGSVGAKVAYVARGDADLYVHGSGAAKRWDTCGPEAVILAAGGCFTDLEGEPIDYTTTDLAIRRGLVASSPVLHARVLAAATRERALHQGSR
jgi:3'(2'), 5'-bisphosphate nucleotidase